MTAYDLFKLLHVITAIAWVGGGGALLYCSVLAQRAHDNPTLFSTLKVMNALGKTWFIPASMLTVVFGAVATTLGGMWAEFWVVLGLAGFAATFFTGMFLIEPTGLRIGAALERGETEAALGSASRLLSVVRFDYTVMAIVVADMVLKPAWGDVVIIAVFAMIILLGAGFFLVPALRQKPAIA